MVPGGIALSICGPFQIVSNLWQGGVSTALR
jgi:hypothetical protein